MFRISDLYIFERNWRFTSVHVTRPTSSHADPIHLNEVRCDWSQPRRNGSLHSSSQRTRFRWN